LKNEVTRIQAALTIFRESGSIECCKECAASRKVAQEVLSHIESGSPLVIKEAVILSAVVEAAEPPRPPESEVVAKLLKERDDLEIELLERYCELREKNHRFSQELGKREKEIERLRGFRMNKS
jgi:hypothetical protein